MALTDALYSLFSFFVQWHRDNYQTLHGKNTIDTIYPIGSIYITVNSSNPSNLFSGTTWVQLTDTFLYAVKDDASDKDSENKDITKSVAGSADAIVVEHNHEQEAHMHYTGPHNHTADALRSIGNRDVILDFGTVSLTQIQKLSPNGLTHLLMMRDGDFRANGGGYEYNTGIAETTATSWEAPFANLNTAKNIATGSSGTNKNMPPYMKVYMWKRTG